MHSDPAGAVALLRRHKLAAEVLPLQAGAFPMWLVQARQPLGGAAGDLLSAAEAERAARFRTPGLRDRYVAAHTGLRLLAEHHYGIPVARQQWMSNEFGKLRLANHATAHCSLSYTGVCALIACSCGGEIGVDIELLRPIENAWELALIHYTPAEQEALTRLRHEPRAFNRAFLAAWVRKEACLKAVGRGLDIPPVTVDGGVREGTRTMRVDGRDMMTGAVQLRGFMVAWARCTETNATAVSGQ